MIIPSIDILGGKAVQLIGGREQRLDAGDPRPIAEQFALAGEVAVVDLDAAMGLGDNKSLILELLRIAPCRVGGGIRTVEAALEWLDAGANTVVLGTKATPEVLSRLPQERVIAALDARDGEVVVEGWQTATGRPVMERMIELDGLVGGFLVTFVEREGLLGGTDLMLAKKLRTIAGKSQLTVAGGITTASEVNTLDQSGIDAQVGTALYTGELPLADAIAAPLQTDRPDGLWATVITDENGTALGLAWSSQASLRAAVSMRSGIYHSRSRGLWTKGETSGAIQQLRRIDLDCDRDALRFTVRQQGPGFCHRGTRTCWGADRGLGRLSRRLLDRVVNPVPGSYTRRLFDDPDLLRSKLMEEALELAKAKSHDEVVWEAADTLYFTFAAMARAGVTLEEVSLELERRSLQVTRRDRGIISSVGVRN